MSKTHHPAPQRRATQTTSAKPSQQPGAATRSNTRTATAPPPRATSAASESRLKARARPLLAKLAVAVARLEASLAKLRLPGRLASLTPRTRLFSFAGIVLILVALATPLTISRVQAAQAEAKLEALVQEANNEGLALHGSPTPAITLKDQYGRTISLNQFKGHPVVLTFFDSVCPHQDCSLMAEYLQWTTKHMTARQVQAVDWVALSVDPWHDTDQTVDQFIQAHQMTMPIHYLMGSEAQLKPLWDALHMQAVLQSDGVVLHTTGVYVLDATGKEQLYLDEGFNPAALAGYLQYMLEHSATNGTQPQTQNTQNTQSKNAVQLEKTVNGDTIHFTATPSAYGTYDFTIELENEQSVPISGATVSAVMTMTDMEMVPVNVNLSPTDIPGTYSAKGQLSMRGAWSARVSVAISGSAPLQTTFDFTTTY